MLTLRGATEPRLGSRISDLGLIADGSVLIKDGRILETGSTRRVANLGAARNVDIIDATGCLVLPGFVDPAVDLLGMRSTLPSMIRRATRLLYHGTTTAGAVSRQKKPLHSEVALASAGLDVAWDVSWEETCNGWVHTPLRNLIEKTEEGSMGVSTIPRGKLVGLSSGFQEPESPACGMLPVIALACLRGEMEIEEAIVAATTNAAHLLGLGLQAGSLDPGRAADLLILDIPDYAKIPYHLGEHLIRTVMKRGRIVCEYPLPSSVDSAAE